MQSDKEELQAILARFEKPDKEGALHVRPAKKTWSRRWLMLIKEILFLWHEKPSLSNPKELKEGPGSVPLLDATVFPADDTKERKFCFLLQTPAKEYLISAESAAERDEWLNAIKKHITLAVELSTTLTAEQEKSLAAMQKLITNPESADRKALIRYLRSNNFDANQAAVLYNYNISWRDQFGVQKLNVGHVAKQLRQGKAMLIPGATDKRGRPVIVARARNHDPNCDFIEILTLLVYLLEKGLRDTGCDEVVLIYDLNNFEKANADNRGMKFLLEIFQNHFPGRVGVAYVVNSPFFYRLLWKLVKPWLSGDLLSRVMMLSSNDGLSAYFTKPNLLPELGGTSQFNLEKWMEETAQKEGVTLPPPGQNLPHPVRDEVAGILQEISAVECEKGARKAGWCKKQGGVIKQWNKRFCCVRGKVFYYFYEKTDKRAEGAIPLTRARIEDNRKGDKEGVFHVITYVNKDCLFEADSAASKKEWVAALNQAIQEANAAGGQP